MYSEKEGAGQGPDSEHCILLIRTKPSSLTIEQKDEIEADLALEAELEQLTPPLPPGLFNQRGRTVSEQFLNEKFAAKIERGEFNEKTYKQCIADELLQEIVYFFFSLTMEFCSFWAMFGPGQIP